MQSMTLRRAFKSRLPLIIAGMMCGILAGCATRQCDEARITVQPDGSMTVDSKSCNDELVKRTTTYQTAPSILAAMPKKMPLARPVDGLFIGISNFGAEGPIPTPAHTIGAGLMYRIFHDATARSSGPAQESNSANPFDNSQDLTNSSLRIMGDLRLDPLDPDWRAKDVTLFLEHINYPGLYAYSSVFEHKAGALWPIVQGKPLTKARVMAAIKEQAERLGRRAKNGSSKAEGILYLATHGVLGPDGTRFALAFDSTATVPTSMISYQEIVDAYVETVGSDQPVKVLIILDTCLGASDNDPGTQVKAIPLQLPMSIALLSAASPGQYAYHWIQAAGLMVNEMTWGIGPLRRKVTNRDLRYFQTMSAVPIALLAGLRRVERFCVEDEKSQPAVATPRDLGKIVEDMVPYLIQEGNVAGRQDAELLVSSSYEILDSYAEMSMSRRDLLQYRLREAVFFTGCRHE